MPSLSNVFGLTPLDIDDMRLDEIVAYLHQLPAFMKAKGGV